MHVIRTLPAALAVASALGCAPATTTYSDADTISPEQARLVLFAPGLEHAEGQFRRKRISAGSSTELGWPPNSSSATRTCRPA